MGEDSRRREACGCRGCGDSISRGISRTDRIAVACAIAFAVLYVSGGVLNGLIYPRVALYFGAAREIATLAGGLTYLCALLIARLRPEYLFVRRTSVVFVVLVVAMAPLLALALELQDPLLTVSALCIRSIARAWAMTLMAASLVRVRNLKSVTLVVTVGLLMGSAARPLMSVLSAFDSSVLFLSVAMAFPVVLLTRIAQPVLDRVRTGAPADVVELLHPCAFLRPSHGLFVCVLLFSAAAGYAMCFREVENAPVETSLFAFVLLVVFVYVFAVKGERQEDLLFSFSAVLVMAGFLMVPVTLSADSTAANLLIDLGENCFEMLLWLMFASIGRRNLFAMLPTFGFAEFCASIGTDVGAMAGHASNALVHGDDRMVMSFALLFAFIFFVFLWLGFRRFSFTEVVFGIEPVVPWPQSGIDSVGSVGRLTEDDGGLARGGRHEEGEETNAEGHPLKGDSAGSMERRCAEIAEVFGLTERESEILGMLARGRNARFIMEEFVLSRNTVKSHIKHIYSKLGVHSQQELIDIAEGK